MGVETEFETETMALIYARQGHYDKAVAIYRHLLSQAPEREDLRHQLGTLEAMLGRGGRQPLSDRFSEWIQLLLKKKQLDKLRRFRKSR